MLFKDNIFDIVYSHGLAYCSAVPIALAATYGICSIYFPLATRMFYFARCTPDRFNTIE